MRRLLQRSTTLQSLLGALEAARAATLAARDAAVAARTGSEAARDASQAARDAAGGHAAAADAAQGQAWAARNEAVNARDASQGWRDAAAAQATAAQASAQTAAARRDEAAEAVVDARDAREDARTARDGAVAARTVAEGARDAAGLHREAAEDARSGALDARDAATAAAESARATALAASAGHGAAGDARVRLGTTADVWPQAVRVAESVSGPAAIQDDGDGPYLVLTGAAGSVVAAWEVDLEVNPGTNPLALAGLASVVALAAPYAEGLVDVSLGVEVLDGSGVPRAYVGAAEATGADGRQVLAAEAVPLRVRSGATSDRGRGSRLRITLAAQVQGGGGSLPVTVALAAAPYLRALAPEWSALQMGKRDITARVVQRPGATALPSVSGQMPTTYLVLGSGTTTLPAGTPERTEVVVIHDAPSGTVTLAAPAGTQLRGDATLTARGARRTCLYHSGVWYVG